MSLLLIIIIIVVCSGGIGYGGYRSYGPVGGGVGLGTILLLLVIYLLFFGGRF